MTPATERLRTATLVARVDYLTAEVARLKVNQGHEPDEIPVPSIRRLVAAVAAEFDVSERAILSPRRDPAFVLPRQVVMHLAVTQLLKSLPIIGRCLHRDHTTVLHGSRNIARRIAAEPDLAARVARVAAAIEPRKETAA